MRTWLFHPLIFYPLALLIAAGVILFSLKPQSLPRDPAPVAGAVSGGELVLEGEAFTSPTDAPEQNINVVRDFWGHAQSLRIAVLPGQTRTPAANEQGVLIQLDPASAAVLEGRRLTVEVSYQPLPVNAASQLAISLQGQSPAHWVTQPIPPQTGTVTFDLPASARVSGLGLRAITRNQDQAYGVEITRIRAVPRP